MSRPQELFAAGAIVLLSAGLVSRLLQSPAQFAVTIPIRGSAYSFSVEAVCLFLAALFAIFAALYAFWLIPMNPTAAQWHFWMTAAGTALFWVYFIAFSRVVRATSDAVATRQNTMMVYLIGGSLVLAFVLLVSGQVLFVTNLAKALIRATRT